jgi:hypothetical protein
VVFHKTGAAITRSFYDCSSEGFRNSHRTTRRYIPEDNRGCTYVTLRGPQIRSNWAISVQKHTSRRATDAQVAPAAVVCLSCTHLSTVFFSHSVLLLVATMHPSGVLSVYFRRSIDLLREFAFNDLSISCEYSFQQSIDLLRVFIFNDRPLVWCLKT